MTAGPIFAALLAVGRSGFTPMNELQPLFYVFVGLITGNVTVVTVVVSITQLLLSRELNSPDELRARMEGTIDYRERVEDTAGRVAPIRPLQFLRLLVENSRTEAQRLGGLAVSETGGEVADEIDSIAAEVTERADDVDGLLQESGVSTFDVLSVTLTTNYAGEINALRRIKSQRGDRLPERVERSIDDLVHSIQRIDIARQYFKVVSLEEELAVLSRLLVSLGLPSVIVVAAGPFSFTATRGASVSPSALVVPVSAMIAVGLLPLIVLLAFSLRIATVSQRTAATVPFTTPTQEK